jgi:uncharacterized protein YutE (UPF0331/DUF86 family)
MVEKSLIYRKLDDLRTYRTQVGEYSGITPGEYSSDWKMQRIVERTLQIMIETCVDISNHIISDEGYRAPRSIADTFVILSESNLLSKELCDTLVKMAKFRNVVVHQYDEVDVEIVVSILRKHLEVFDGFEMEIRKYLRNIK